MRVLAFLLLGFALTFSFMAYRDASAQVSGQPTQGCVTRLDGGDLAYYHWLGEGPNLLLIPGSWMEYSQFDEIREHLDPNLNLVIVELPGHGKSLPPTLNGSIPSFATDVLRVTDALGWKQWYAGGHSIGGMITIELAGQRPEQLAGVISIEGWTNSGVVGEAFDGIVRNTLSEEQQQLLQEARNRTLDRLTPEEKAAFGSIWKTWDGLPVLQETTAPVLELWGDRKLSPRPSRQEMSIPDRANIDLRWIADASHELPLERPQEVATAINSVIFGSSSPAGFLTNGDFEMATPVGGTFPTGWTIVLGAPSRHAGLAGTSNAVFLDADRGDRIHQEFTKIEPQWELECYFANEKPTPGKAALEFMFCTDRTVGKTILDLRVVEDGSIQAYTGSWTTVMPSGTVTFSVDANGDGDFEDADDMLNVHHMKIFGDSSTGRFTLSISNPNEVDYAHSAVSTAWASSPAGLVSLDVSAKYSTGSFVVDEIVLTSVPEPGVSVLLIGSLMFLLSWRRDR